MMWGCMGWEGVGYATRIEGKMDARLYTDILGDEPLKSLEWFSLNVEEVYFQQDNDPKHTSKLAKKWFENQGFKVLLWPAQSPDLNPVIYTPPPILEIPVGFQLESGCIPGEFQFCICFLNNSSVSLIT